MNIINTFIARTIKPCLFIFGLVTCTILPIAVDIRFLTPILGGVVDYTPSSAPALRHWGFVVFGIGVLMVVASFRPWLRFETMLLCTAEKAFVAYLFLSSLGQPGINGYLPAVVLDSTIAAYGILYFISDQGRPQGWR